MTQRELSKLYADLNQHFFRGGLHRFRVRFKEAPPRIDKLRGRCDAPSQTIRLAPGLPDDEIRRVLLHEMCHIGSRGHGVRFCDKLKRLAQMGETWAEKERVHYEEVGRTPVPFSTQLRHLVDDLASSGQQITKSEAIKIIAREKGMSRAELLCKAPWLPNVWARVNKTNQAMRKLTEQFKQKARSQRGQ